MKHIQEWWGRPARLDSVSFEHEETESHLQKAGFEIVESLEGDLYPEVEVQTRRIYIFAGKL